MHLGLFELGDTLPLDPSTRSAVIYDTSRLPANLLGATMRAQVVSTNLLGVLICSRQALSLFAKQPGGYGHLFNMDGAGACAARGKVTKEAPNNSAPCTH